MTTGTARFTASSTTNDMKALRSQIIERAYHLAMQNVAHTPDVFGQMYTRAMSAFTKTTYNGTERHAGTIVPAQFTPATDAYGAKVVAFKHLLHRINKADISDDVRSQLEIRLDSAQSPTFWIKGVRDKTVPYVSLELALRKHANAQGTYEAKLQLWTNDTLVKDICNVAGDRKRPVLVARAKNAAFAAYRHLGMTGDYK
jgi:hypothetical protein